MVDWSELLVHVRGRGLTESYIAHYCGVSRYAIDRWLRGVNQKEPPFTVGLKMLRLHRRECPERHEREVYGVI